MSDSLIDRVKKAVADTFGIPLEQVTDDTSSDDVETWDSFNMINLLMVLEGEFGISLSPEDASDMMSVRLIVEVLKERGAA